MKIKELTMAEEDFISIKGSGFGSQNEKVNLLFLSLLGGLGIFGIILDWKSGTCALAALLLLYGIHNWGTFKYRVLIGAVIAVVAAYTWRKEIPLDLVSFICTGVFLPFFLFFKPFFSKGKEEAFELFYLDKLTFRCIHNYNNDYRGYALQPKSFLKTYEVKDIKAISFEAKTIIFFMRDLVVRPKELTSIDVDAIHRYVKIHLPHLLKQDQIISASLKDERRLSLLKLVAWLPTFLFAVALVFFADNGRNVPFTYICIALMILSPIVTYRILNAKR